MSRPDQALVRIRVGDIGPGYQVSKTFHPMFKGQFLEAATGCVSMHPIQGVVSDRSLRNLLRWLRAYDDYIDHTSAPQSQITEVLELARLADMCLHRGADQNFAQIINILRFMNPLLQYHAILITNEHLYSATRLPRGNAVRAAIVRAWIGI